MDEEYLKELFEGFAPVQVKKMFGALGIFYHNLNIAGVMDGVLHLRGDETTAPEFAEEGYGQWVYTRKDGKAVDMPYYEVPARLFDDPDEFARWASDAFEAAKRADAKKPPSKRKLQ